MKKLIFLAFLALVLAGIALAEENATNTTNATTLTIDPWAKEGKVCTFINVFIKTPVFIIIFLVFLLGVATISGAAFPQWRNYGSKMVLGSIGAALLYIIGMAALRFLTDSNVCGLAPF